MLPRAMPIVEAMLALVLADHRLRRAARWAPRSRGELSSRAMSVSSRVSSRSTARTRAEVRARHAIKHVPVYPVLAAMLAEWKLGGWAEMMGRAPTPDDLIVPLPPDAAERRRSRDGEPFRGHDYSGKRWREAELPALGWRHRRRYDMRATFITLAIEDGADADVIERG